MIGVTTLRIASTLLAIGGGVAAVAQDGSLIRQNARMAGVGPTLRNSSFIYQTLPPDAMVQPLEVESIVTVLVDYRTVMQSEGSGETIKTGAFSAVLADWIGLDGKSIFAAPQRRGDPAISGTLNSQFRAESDIEQRESLTFEIACKVIDIRPNGNLVLEGTRTMQVNEERWVTYLSGIVPRNRIGPDNTVRDTAMADLRVRKYEEGFVRDGYARGWLSRLHGKWKPF